MSEPASNAEANAAKLDVPSVVVRYQQQQQQQQQQQNSRQRRLHQTARSSGAGGATSTLRQQGSGDTGLGSSLEYSPAATPIRGASEERPGTPPPTVHRPVAVASTSAATADGLETLATTESTWMKWSRDRRSKQQQRLQAQQHQQAQELQRQLVQQQQQQQEEADSEDSCDSLPPAAPGERVTTPILKARKESANLMAPELHNRRLIMQVGVVEPNVRIGGARRTLAQHHHQQHQQELSPAQWSRLRNYWEHPTFVQSRVAALFLALGGAALLVASASTVRWSHHTPDNSSTAWSGLWRTCFRPNGSCSANFHLTHLAGYDWQKAILGLLLFSLLFSISGSVLAVLGICVEFLPKKMYYLHSGGEMCFVAALASSVGLALYPYAVLKLGYQRHRYGTAYWIGWSACLLLALASLSLMLDHLVRELSRPRSCPRRLRRLFPRRRRKRPVVEFAATSVKPKPAGTADEADQDV